MSSEIDYGGLMHRALRGLIRSVLEDVARHGLPGQHHFFITFDTNAPGVVMADWLRERYPHEMTVVLQHWFSGLEVDEDGFRVTLNFGNQPESLEIPFDSLRTFVDPSVEFGLRFESHDAADEDGAEAEPPEAGTRQAPDGAPPEGQGPASRPEAEIVSLDQFRKT